MKRVLLALAFFLMVIPFSGAGQYWVVDYDTERYAWLEGMTLVDENIMVTGTFTMAVDKNGSILWVKDIKGVDIEAFSGGAVLVGGRPNPYVAKLSGNGEVEWQKRYVGNGVFVPAKVAVDPDGAIIAVGTSWPDKGDSDIWVLWLDENGSVLRSRIYGTGYDDEGRAVVLAQNGDIVVAGTTSFGTDKVILILKISQNGRIEWSKAYDGSYSDVPNDIVLTSEGIVVAGNKYRLNLVDYIDDKPLYEELLKDSWLLFLDEEGSIKGAYSYWKEGKLTSIDMTQEGHLIAGGIIWELQPISGHASYLKVFPSILGVDGEGDVLWHWVCGGDNGDVGDVEVTSEIFLAGFLGKFPRDFSSYGERKALIMRIPLNGDLWWCSICREGNAAKRPIEFREVHVELKGKDVEAIPHEINTQVKDVNVKREVLCHVEMDIPGSSSVVCEASAKITGSALVIVLAMVLAAVMVIKGKRS
ncbi:hypothetical protein PAP_05095 [Palaeococcus pacificus DY20341]|uniref:Bulb-type lectin domain-containing protein n=1 Tax=Palaeococcus pacificus DY20341 TaxID=1343739 RepID=A0A075LRQ0_9EURY|nr:hypothetical protein [Palaeococcus pacificus]AIF69430.1 hypothetical protein PAP_05095 [Palaeococcus pacificus DY20341]